MKNNVRLTTGLSIAIYVSILIVSIYFISKSTITSAFAQLEREMLQKSMASCREVIANRIRQFSIKISDWSTWDDLFFFVDDRNQAFVTSNLNQITLTNLHIDALLILDEAGEVVSSILSEKFSSDKSPGREIPPGMKNFLRADSHFLNHKTCQSFSEGLIILPIGPAILASRPITKSDYSGNEINGTILFAKVVDAKELEYLGNLLKANIDIRQINQIAENGFYSKALLSLSNGSTYHIEELDENRIVCFFPLADVSGKMHLIGNISMPREINHLGLKTLNYFIFGLLLAGALFSLAVYVPLEKEISKRIQAETELIELKNRFEQVSEFSHEVFWEVDANGLYTYLSKSVKDCLGYDPKEIIGQKSFFDFFPENDRSELKEKVFRIFSEKRPFINLENGAITRDGKLVWLITSGFPIIDNEGNLKGYRGSDYDISDRKKTELMLLKAKEDAEAATKAKGYFLANMSHEIRTPMNAILGFASLLEKSRLDEKQKEFLSIIQKSGKLLQEIISNILDISKFESLQFTLEEIEFDLAGICHDAMKIALTRHSSSQITSFVSISPDVPKKLIGDPTRIQQILVNLLNNALKFTPEGTIEINVSIQSVISEDLVILLIKVSDTGIGIPEEKTQSIFQPFTQIDETITRKYGGTGLGLSICKAIIENYQGEIRVESEVGKGSNFIFTLKLKVPKQEKTVSTIIVSTEKPYKPEETTKPEKQIRVLVAEDDPGSRKLMKEYLSILGYQFEFAENGLEALEKLKAGSFSICFMDLQMPELDGINTTATIRREISQDLPIVALSASVMAKDRRECDAVGMNDYLSKPVSIEMLSTCINRFFPES